METDLALLHQKIDYLTAQVEEQRKRQQGFEELKQDMLPIVNHLIKLSIDELAEIGMDFELEDLLFLLKRLLRDTRKFILLLDRVDALMDLADEVGLLGKQMFSNAVENLDRLEREGYFGIARGGWHIVERLAQEFSEDEIKDLGDLAVSTLHSVAQPDTLRLVSQAAQAIQEPEPDRVSALFLIRQLADPQTRKGLARMLNVVKALSDSPDSKI